jgi:hypothetical protein
MLTKKIAVVKSNIVEYRSFLRYVAKAYRITCSPKNCLPSIINRKIIIAISLMQNRISNSKTE